MNFASRGRKTAKKHTEDAKIKCSVVHWREGGGRNSNALKQAICTFKSKIAQKLKCKFHRKLGAVLIFWSI